MKWRQAKKKRMVRKRRDAIKQRKMLFQELEPRVLYSADGIGGADALTSDDNIVEAVIEQTVLTEAELVEIASEAPPPIDLSAFGAEAEREPTREIVFVDTDTEDYQQLIDDLLNDSGEDRSFDVFVLDNTRDGIEQISDVLSGYDSVDAVHIISHGVDGSIDLGATQFDLDALNANADEIGTWSGAFAESGDFLIYGCNLATSADGQSFVDTLARLTETDVAASDDLTGAAILGGDWDLEYNSGDIETDVALSLEVQQNWSNLLAIPTITSDGGGPTAAINAAENQTAVTTVTYTDADLPADTITYSVSGVDAALFSIDGSGVLTFNTAPDFETPTDADSNGVYEVTVQVDDGNLGIDTQAISITVTDDNDAPLYRALITGCVKLKTTRCGRASSHGRYAHRDRCVPGESADVSATIEGALGVLIIVAAGGLTSWITAWPRSKLSQTGDDHE